MSPRQSRRGFVKACAALPLLGAASSFHVHLRAAEAKQPFATDNEKINQARDVALGVLQPTPKQLEHGLRLHAESLVFESYGFAPRAAVDGEKFKATVESGASEAELTDLSEEMMMTRWATDARERKEFLDAMHAAGVTCIFQNTGEEGSDPLRLIKRLWTRCGCSSTWFTWMVWS
jgi:membrane dipeptidase